MTNLEEIRTLLHENALKHTFKPIFFKTGLGEYAEHDQFIGVSMPTLRNLAKMATELSLTDISVMFKSPFNEERQLALLILIKLYQKSERKNEIYQFLLTHINYVNNWNLVDNVAPAIIGVHLFNQDKTLLFTFAASNDLWKRRIAIVATHYFIKQGSFEWTLKIAEILVNDSHDLIHKAVGWMLRELGKRDESLLKQFLDVFSPKMARTMLRYAIERLSKDSRLFYLKNKS